ncbi:MAG: Nramp family divalent metal transporter [Dictyoglomus turgidum]|jgi:manganese transport protein
MRKFMQRFLKGHKPTLGALEILKYIGPGFLVTVGFIDPGNWASNMAAGSQFGYKLLWMVTLSTIMLIFLQHNAAHLGIATGLCLSEAISKYFPKFLRYFVLVTAMLASISTALAEILGAAIGLNMLFNIPINIGAFITTIVVILMLLSNSYRKIEKYIIGFVSLIGLSFLFELSLVKINWKSAIQGWIIPSFPQNSIPIIMSVLGAVVMPHNLFLHSEIIQSRQWNLEDESIIRKQLKYEYLDTIGAMLVGWAINSSMILIAAEAFYKNGILITELPQAYLTLKPLLGHLASYVFAIALIFSGFSSSMTAGMAGGSTWAGMSNEPFDVKDNHTRIGILITLIGALFVIFFISNPFQGLIWSQIMLSIQLPFTIFSLIRLTSWEKVMGKFKNSKIDNIILITIGIIVTLLNITLFLSFL